MNSVEKILWLKVSYTKRDELVVCQYYLNAIRTLGAPSRKVRAERGIEMVDICSVQICIRTS